MHNIKSGMISVLLSLLLAANAQAQGGIGTQLGQMLTGGGAGANMAQTAQMAKAAPGAEAVG